MTTTRLLVLLLVAVPFVSAQVKHEVCYRKTDTSGGSPVVTERCITVSGDLVVSMNQWNASLQTPYKGPAEMVFKSLLSGLFTPLLGSFPPTAIANLKTAVDTATAALEAGKAAALPTLPEDEP